MQIESIHNEFARAARQLRRFGRRAGMPWEADELVQEAWLFLLQRPSVEREFVPWIRGVLHNMGRSAERSELRRKQRELRYARSLPEFSGGADAHAIRMDQQEWLEVALASIPRAQAQAIRDRYLEQLSLATMSARGGLPVETYRTRIRRGLANLREIARDADCG